MKDIKKREEDYDQTALHFSAMALPPSVPLTNIIASRRNL